mgnify:CR=1 FL=1
MARSEQCETDAMRTLCVCLKAHMYVGWGAQQATGTAAIGADNYLSTPFNLPNTQ